ncbi:MAG TPA: ATP-binding cassette domain-containing protein [Anaerolineae bacterium]|nr:ATP-binding cassette domain-containing protein [Anaerolineae bacterium]
MYQLRDIKQIYAGRTVLHLPQLDIVAGETLALIGPSGAGKSTLLRLLAFLERPIEGKILFRERLVQGDSWPTLAERREVTLVFQRPLLLKRSVRENIEFGVDLRGKHGQADVLIAELTRKLGLSDHLGKPAHTLSGGELQRVALARALAIRPKILLLDEPTANLDPGNIKLIETIIRDSTATGTTVVIVTHNIFQAKRLADRTGLLIGGELIEIGRTTTLFETPSHPQTAAFLRGDIIF